MRTGRALAAGKRAEKRGEQHASNGPNHGPGRGHRASGYIGSWIVRDLVQHGYQVRACVRNPDLPEKVEHLLALRELGNGDVSLTTADLRDEGSYDDAFAGCAGVIHAGAAVGYNRETPQEVYDGCFTEVRHVVESALKATSVRRFVFTSSFAAVGHPRPAGYVFTEADWCSDNPEGYKGAWTRKSIPKNRDIAYAMAKAETERMLYDLAAQHEQFEAISILPLHVIGPLMCANHDQGWSWQNCIRFMMRGKPYAKSRGGRMLWNLVDVRDVASAHRLCLESNAAANGSRYILSAADPSGELFTWQLSDRLAALFPEVSAIGGEPMVDGVPEKPTYDSPRAYCRLAMDELGLRPRPVDEALRATVESYRSLGLLDA